jgi:cytochrome c553
VTWRIAPRSLALAAAVALAANAGLAGAQIPPARTAPPPEAAGPAARPASASAAASAIGDATADYSQRYAAVCAACHGANGRSDQPGVPVLAGQSSLYAITQLFLFREGRRDNPSMVAVARPMTDADLRGFSDAIGRLPPVPAPHTAPPEEARMAQGRVLAEQHKCVMCHGADLAGGQQVPRIGGQKEDYLRRTLHGFKSGQRPGYTRAMTEALSQVPEADLDPLAYYIARVPPAAAR